VFAGFSFAGGHADPLPTTYGQRPHLGVAFALSQQTAPVGTIVFTITNTVQSEPHDFALNGRTSAVLMPGQSTTLAVTFTQPGIYPYTDTRADTDREIDRAVRPSMRWGTA
jgi:hypothetical protein